MSNNTPGSSEWMITPVGRTALEQVLARHLSVAITLESIVFSEPDAPSFTKGADNGFAPRRVTLTTRSGRGDSERIDLFFKIPGEREVEAHVLGRRLGIRHQPRILVSSLDIQRNGVEAKAFCYIYVPGKPLSEDEDADVFTADSLPPGIVSDVALLHASTAGQAEAYLRRGYSPAVKERLKEAAIFTPAEYSDLPYVRENADSVRSILERAAGAFDEVVALATRGGPVVVHGELEPRNIIVDADGGSTLVDWGSLGLGWAALDLAPCLAYDQVSLYLERAADRNRSWKPPGEKSLAAARIVHSLTRFKLFALNGSDEASSSPRVIKRLLERMEEALDRLQR